MKWTAVLVDIILLLALALPGITIYRLAPDFIFAYSGAALLAVIGAGWLLARRPKDVA